MNSIKRLLVSAPPFLANSCKEVSKPTAAVQMLDPKDVLLSLPTLCDPAPAVEESAAPTGARGSREKQLARRSRPSKSNIGKPQDSTASISEKSIRIHSKHWLYNTSPANAIRSFKRPYRMPHASL